jgi:hypothetical protein
MVELQLAMRQLPEVHPSTEMLRYAVAQIAEVGATLYGVREKIDA